MVQKITKELISRFSLDISSFFFDDFIPSVHKKKRRNELLRFYSSSSKKSSTRSINCSLPSSFPCSINSSMLNLLFKLFEYSCFIPYHNFNQVVTVILCKNFDKYPPFSVKNEKKEDKHLTMIVDMTAIDMNTALSVCTF